jgi:HSP20 family protein
MTGSTRAGFERRREMLVRRNSLVPVRRNEAFDRLFDDLFRGFQPSTSFAAESGFPALDTWEDNKGYHVEAELPGFEENDIEISVLGNELRIGGSREAQKEEGEKTWHRRERYLGSFSRAVSFPVDVESGKVEARYENGLLRISLPKAETALPRKVEVKRG